MCPLRVREILPEEMAFGLGHWREQEFPGQSGAAGGHSRQRKQQVQSRGHLNLSCSGSPKGPFMCGFQAGGTDWGTGSLGIRPRGLGFILVGVFLEIQRQGLQGDLLGGDPRKASLGSGEGKKRESVKDCYLGRYRCGRRGSLGDGVEHRTHSYRHPTAKEAGEVIH